MSLFDFKKDKKGEFKETKFEEKSEKDVEEAEDGECPVILEKENFAFINLEVIYENGSDDKEMVLELLKCLNILEKKNFVFVEFYSGEKLPNGILFKKKEAFK